MSPPELKIGGREGLTLLVAVNDDDDDDDDGGGGGEEGRAAFNKRVDTAVCF